MIEERKNKLDKLWNESELWEYIHMKASERDEFRNQKEVCFQKNEPHMDFSWLSLESERYAGILGKEFSDWNDYTEYMKTFNDETIELMYDLDVFDSFMTKKLH